jgi:hypothetical protein
MATYPLDPSYVIPKRSVAMRYLKSYKAHLRERAAKLTEDILALDDDLREPVAFMAEALAQNLGHFWAKHIETGANGIGRGMIIHHVDFDDDVLDAYEARFGEEALEEAAKWILVRLDGETAVFVSWALGPIRFKQESHLTVLEDRILFNLLRREFEAVLSHKDWRDPDCVHYLVKGGQVKRGAPVGHRIC